MKFIYKNLVMVCIVMMQTISFGANISKTIYINSGSYTAYAGVQFPYKAFNETATFSIENARVAMNTGDSLFLKVINNDSIVHEFGIQDYALAVQSINPGDSISIAFSSNIQREYIYYDPLAYPDQTSLGLAGMISVSNASTHFYWNIKDVSAAFSDSIVNIATVNWSNYYPDYFTINGNSHPNINTDPAARIVGNVGDTLTIHITNTGQSIHSLHFHGYHCEILHSSLNSNQIGRSKDTFPIKSMETLTLELVPHQVGEYPVHDHNLLAITSGGLYPFGMFLTILIQ